MSTLTDRELSTLLAENPAAGWRAFIDQHTITILAQIERAGIADRDEAMEVYVLVCEHLSQDNCARLARHDPAKGTLRAWLGVVVRRLIVDWIRSRAGRRRLFGVVRGLPALDQRVFELYYWERRSPTQIAELLATGQRAGVTLADVLDALRRIDGVLTDRHRSELLSLAARSRQALSLDEDPQLGERLTDDHGDPEQRLRVDQMDAAFRSALNRLSPEDAAFVRLKFVQGLSYGEIRRALHLARPAEERMREVLERLRELLAGVAAGDAAPAAHLAFLSGDE